MAGDELARRFGLPAWSFALTATDANRWAIRLLVSPAPRTGTESAAHADAELEDYLHVYLLNRGVLLTPFQNMALMCPATTAADVSRHHEIFDSALCTLLD
ncbi:hypothetical protein [Actinoplanes sp. NPDC049316]|uniref:hypothetical protein n=1 Tax=Actinoplanes sp. NPDC049316 TaxID=3154727 RepID=UPI003428C716